MDELQKIVISESEIQYEIKDDGTSLLWSMGGGGMPSWVQNPGDDEPEDLNLPQEISLHLQDGQVAVFTEAGGEKARYVSGFAIAVDWYGNEEIVSIHDIYQRAAEAFGVPRDSITEATY